MFSRKIDLQILRLANRLLSITGMKLVARDWASGFRPAAELDSDFLAFISSIEADTASEVLRVLSQSRAQLRQDLVVIGLVSAKRDGFFVEFGACDGVTLSNTYLLEDSFGWSGILAEPARVWHSTLMESRQCAVDFRCVAPISGQMLPFLEAETAELSTLSEFKYADRHYRNGLEYEVETVSLNDLLLYHRAPQGFDYLSVDTEGSELGILMEFDFDYWRPKVVTVEHNFTSVKAEIEQLLDQNGYQQVLPQMSRWDSWFIRA